MLPGQVARFQIQVTGLPPAAPPQSRIQLQPWPLRGLLSLGYYHPPNSLFFLGAILWSSVSPGVGGQ